MVAARWQPNRQERLKKKELVNMAEPGTMTRSIRQCGAKKCGDHAFPTRNPLITGDGPHPTTEAKTRKHEKKRDELIFGT